MAIIIVLFLIRNLNMGPINQLAPYSVGDDRRLEHLVNDPNSESAQLAALAMAQARDGALVDGSLLKQRISSLNSRHLLADNNDEDEASPNTTTRSNNGVTNATRNRDGAVRVNGMDLVLINGTWHVVDFSICQQMFSNQTSANRSAGPHHQQYYNYTHFNRLVKEKLNFLKFISK